MRTQPLAVAETGSVLLTESELRVNTIGFLAHDIVILLDPKQIVENIHDAYQQPALRESKYAELMTGPSGSADIGGITVHPAQGRHDSNGNSLAGWSLISLIGSRNLSLLLEKLFQMLQRDIRFRLDRFDGIESNMRYQHGISRLQDRMIRGQRWFNIEHI